MTVLTAPSVRLSWTATSLGADFRAYRIYRRPSRTPAPDWELIGEIDVPAGYTAADVEAQHLSFVGYEAGWLSPDAGQWQDGWDYAVSVVDDAKNTESPLSTVSRVTVTGDAHPWLTANAAPYLNMPIEQMASANAEDDDLLRIYSAAGRDQTVTRTALELPARRYKLSWDAFARTGEDQVRGWRAAASSGLSACLLLPLGDRVIGSPSALEVSHTDDLTLSASMGLTETARASTTAWYTEPCGLVLNGTSQYVEHGDAVTLDAQSSQTVFCYGAFAPASGNENLIAKGDGSGEGWRLYTTPSNTVSLEVRSASGNVTATDTDTRWFDGTARLATGVFTSASQVVYLDDEVATTSSSTTTTVNNAHPVRVGCLSSSVTELLAGHFRAWGVYGRALTATEVANLWHYLAGHPGYRPPATPALFVDLRDDRCWSGTDTLLHDLSDNGLYGTVVAAPPTRGRPWPLRILDRF